MFRLVLSPQWFYGIDMIFEAIAIIVVFLIALSSFSFYKFSRQVRYKYFGLSFLAISISFMAKILTNVMVYSSRVQQFTFESIIHAYGLIEGSKLFYHVGFFAHQFLMLLGLLGIYYIVSKSRLDSKIVLFVFFIAQLTLLTTFKYFTFYVASALLTALIVIHLQKSKSEQKNAKKDLVIPAFSMLFVSQVVFNFIYIDNIAYVVAEVLQLIAYLILLYEYYKLVLKK